MSLSLYMDVHVPRAITRTLAAAGVNVITAQEDGCSEMPDPDLLDRAGSLNRVLFTRDDDLLTEATRRQRAGMTFYGVIYAHQMRAKTDGGSILFLLIQKSKINNHQSSISPSSPLIHIHLSRFPSSAHFLPARPVDMRGPTRMALT